MPSSDPLQRFQDILDNIGRISRFTAGLNLQTSSENEQALFAVKHALLIVSEASAKLGALAAELCPAVPWADIRGLGNRLRHDYHAFLINCSGPSVTLSVAVSSWTSLGLALSVSGTFVMERIEATIAVQELRRSVSACLESGPGNGHLRGEQSPAALSQ